MFKKLCTSSATGRTDIGRILSTLVTVGLAEDREIDSNFTTDLNDIRRHVPDENQHGVAITLYQCGVKPFRVVRQRQSFLENIVTSIAATRRHPRFDDFSVLDKARIQFDFFGFVDRDVRFGRFSTLFPSDGFEYGIDGLRIRTDAQHHYFLPGDSYVHSILGLGQLRRYLSRSTGLDDIENHAMDRLRSSSFVSFGDCWLPLYRGHPVLQNVTVEDVRTICRRAIENIVSNFRSDGRFMYYFDTSSNSHLDHEHPRRSPENNPYYNELRHCGGIITLLLHHSKDPDAEAVSTVCRAIDFLIKISQLYETSDKRVARYLVYNRKSKLGGAGLALYTLALFQHITGIDRHANIAREFANHLISELLSNGEFRYYYIYLDHPVSEKENSRHFSFYYPGEALIGLAAYLKWVETDKPRCGEIGAKIKLALRYLLTDRPRERVSEYTALPSDSWLMAAINELWDLPEFRDPSYAQFVFDDADRMVERMYTEASAPFPDYAGAFYYQFGDFPYPDGARCEGLVAALSLAKKLELDSRVRRYASSLVKTTRATLLLANTPESLYFAADPTKALGGIRFKLTRQWFRIDTIQHVVCYYYRFLDLYDRLKEKGVMLEDAFSESIRS